jgi:aquaporin Z
MAEVTMMSKVIAEFTGTFLLVFTIGCNVMSHTAVWAPVSIACVLMVAIYSFGGISGANFNPAVSITLGISKSMGLSNGLDWKDVAIYSVVQIAGGLFAGLCYLGMFGAAFNLEPAKGFGIASAGTCELLYTFMLCFVVLNVAVAETPKGTIKKTPNEYYGLAIGFVIIAGAYGAGAVSGGCFNPAVAIGIDMASAYLGLGYCFAYWIFEIAGAVLAAIVFKLVRPNDFTDPKGDGVPGTVEKLTSEFLGTYMLVLTVGLNVLGKSPAGAFSIAASLMCMIFALGDISGAHFNPAVTLAITVSGLCADFSGKDAVMYMLTQLAGGVAAAYTYASIYKGDTFPLGPGAKYNWSQVAVAEIVFTFVLCLVVLGAAVSEKTKTTTMFGWAIGSCVTVGGFAIGSISGGSLNPAVSVGIASSQILNGGYFYKALIYSLFEFIGAAMAAGVVVVTHPRVADEKKPLIQDKVPQGDKKKAVTIRETGGQAV